MDPMSQVRILDEDDSISLQANPTFLYTPAIKTD